MKRTPLRRKKPLRAKKPLQSRRLLKNAGGVTRSSISMKGSGGLSRIRRGKSSSTADVASRKSRKRDTQRLNGAARFEANKTLAIPKALPEKDEGLCDWIRQQSCILSGRSGHQCWLPVAVCHIKTRGSRGGDVDNVFPGCIVAHSEQEGHTKEFEAKWNLNLKEEAKFYREKYLKFVAMER